MAGAIAGLAHHALSQDFRRIDPKQARILLIEAAPGCSAPSPKTSRPMRQALERLGVTVLTEHAVEDVSEEGVTVAGKLIRPHHRLGRRRARLAGGGMARGRDDPYGPCAVGPDLAVIGRPGVYALGDLAMTKGEDGKPLPGLAQVADSRAAISAAPCATASCAERCESLPLPQPRQPGDHRAQFRRGAVGPRQAQGFPAWVVWGVAHVYLLVGFHNRLVVTLRWLWAYLSFQRGRRLISERDEAVMALIRGTPARPHPPP